MSDTPMHGLEHLWARPARLLFLAWLAAAPQVWAAPSDFDFKAPAAVAAPAMPSAMRDLAGRMVPVYEDPDPDRYLANLSVLQMTAGEFQAAYGSRQSLLDRRRNGDKDRPVTRGMVFDLYAHAKSMQLEQRLSFPDAFAKAFHEDVVRLDDQDAYAADQWLQTPPGTYRETLQKLLDRLRTTDSISTTDALALMWAYVAYEAYRDFGPLIGPLEAEDGRRRYSVEEAAVPLTGGARIAAFIVRPKNADGAVPTLLEFTIHQSEEYARESAARGYAGVVAYARRDADAPRGYVPFEHDGDDAREVINWIAKQPWSDGRVGMYGEGYSGFTPWAAAKRPPAALKAIATAAASAPGIDIPMQGNIFQNSGYRWSLHVVDPDAGLPPDDEASWRAFDEKWYKSGSRYRDLGRLFGRPNPLFIRWLNHPSYDRYWQKMVPFREEFARINIPVLTTTGYYAPSEPGDLYFFTEHHRFNPRADHTLLIGPYDDAVMQRGLSPALRGYQVDAAAQVDQRELRYRWFDHVFKGTPPPSLLTDPVNYQVMGANEWHHAASLDAMGAKPIRFFLSAAATGTGHRLTKRRRTQAAYTEQIVSLADRTDAGWTAPADLVAKSAAAHLGTLFVSEPLPKPVEFSGRFSGRLDFTVNKMDMDLYIALYERLPNGDYVPLFSPSYEFRASYAQDRTHRRLLKAGEQQALTFRSERLMSRRLQAGSRLVIVLGIDKRPDREINYGTGNDVSEESLADGDTAPLEVRWYGDSYVEMPVHR